MKITFEGATLQRAVAGINAFLRELAAQNLPATSVDPTSSPTGDQTEKPAKSTRTARKRSKPSSEAESDDAKSEPTEEKPEPTTRRRRARSTEDNAQTPAAKGRTRKRASAASPSIPGAENSLSSSSSVIPVLRLTEPGHFIQRSAPLAPRGECVKSSAMATTMYHFT